MPSQPACTRRIWVSNQASRSDRADGGLTRLARYAEADTSISRQIGSTPKRSRFASVTRSPRTGLVEFAGEKHARRLEDLVAAAQVAHLTAQGHELAALGGGQPIGTATVVGLVLAHPHPQGLGVQAQITRARGERAFGLPGDPDAALSELGRILRGSWHGSDSFLQDQVILEEGVRS